MRCIVSELPPLEVSRRVGRKPPDSLWRPTVGATTSDGFVWASDPVSASRPGAAVIRRLPGRVYADGRDGHADARCG